MFRLAVAMLALALVAMFFHQMANATAGLRARLSLRDRLRYAVLGLGIDASGVVTLAQAQNLTQDDIDVQVIDEFRKSAWLLDALPFDDVVSPTGGGTLTYGYNRLITQPSAGFRAINSEYTPQEVTVQRYTTDLKPLGGSFQIDRVVARLGSAAANEVSLQMSQKIKAASATFNDAIINGDSAVDANSFDGLNKALTGSTTEIGTGAVTDWSNLATNSDFLGALDELDLLLTLLDGAPTAIIANRKAMAKIRRVVRGLGFYTRDVIQLVNGSMFVEQYGNVTLVDPGTKAGSNTDVIPVHNATVGGSAATGLTDIYAVRIGMDGFHGASMAGQPLVHQWLPNFDLAGAVKTGEVEMGPVGVVLKATRAAAVLRNVKVA